MGTNFTLDDLKALEQAMAAGAIEVSYKDRRVRYESFSAMQQARRLMRRALGLDVGPQRVVPKTSKGL